MKIDPRLKTIRNLWTNPANIFDHEEIERSFAEFLDRTMQRYDSKRAALGILRSQRNVLQFLSRGGLLKQALASEDNSSSPSSTSSSLSDSSSTPVTSSAGAGRPVRSCTLSTPTTKTVLPGAAAFSRKKTATKAKNSVRGNSTSRFINAPATTRGNQKSSLKYNSDSSSLSTSSGASESAAVYQNNS